MQYTNDERRNTKTSMQAIKRINVLYQENEKKASPENVLIRGGKVDTFDSPKCNSDIGV